MTLRISLKPRKCKQCGEIFQRRTTTQTVCGPKCAEANAAKVRAQKAAKADKENRKSFREAIEKAKTRADHLREAQTAVNAYVRLRDANDPCISCDRPPTWGGQWHASHYRSVGSNPGWRFSLWNISKACSICNVWKSGSLTEYRPRLIEKIGLDRVEMLEREAPVRKYDIEYLCRLKRIFRKKARREKARRELGIEKILHAA